MMNENIESKLLDYLDGNLPDYERRELEDRLARDAALRQTLDELIRLQAEIDRTPEYAPSPQLETRFLTLLSAEKNAAPKTGIRGKLVSFLSQSRFQWELAAAVVLLLIGVGFGWFWRVHQRQQMELQALRMEMRGTQRMLVLAMLEKPSASDRIRAVNVLQTEQSDPKIIDALILTMNFDDMANVRMKAVQALSHFGDNMRVKDALISSLRTQESPEVQITIIETLVALGEKRALPSLEKMLEDKELMDVVRRRAATGIHALL